VAGDIGGAVKGNVIDLYFDTAAEVRAFGRQKRTVYVIE
jgi:3D (Asp-Asp-Asp) domain-containing protein